jgi:hypothetical protein
MPNQLEFEYDVFISYSSRDKGWVRGELLKGIESAGLRAFIDFRDFKRGATGMREMERGVTICRKTLLVLTPNYIESEWCEIESIMSQKLGAANRSLRLIPLLKTECEEPSHIGALTHIDFTDGADFELAWRQLLTALGSQAAQLQVADINDVLKWKWDGRKLLEKLIELDYLTTAQLTHPNEGDPDQWGPVFMNNPETWRLLITEPENIVGYWHIASLFQPEYELAKNGKLLDSQITADTVQVFGNCDLCNIYFVQVCMHPQYRRPRQVRLLFESFFEVLDILSADGIFVREICANAFTNVGVSLCRSFNLERICKHSEHGEIYFGQISAVLKHSLARRFPELQKRYTKKLIEGFD